jgi:hypothetical protein
MMDAAEWKAHLEHASDEIKQLRERADALERILPNLADAEAKRKAEQLIELYRLHAEKLSEHIA